MLASLLLVAAGLTISGAGADAQTAGTSENPDISADGRYVVFQTTKALATADRNGASDIYLRDTQANRTELISRTSGGAAGNKMSVKPSVSTDGRWVAFESAATDLVRNDTNGARDVFLWDRTNQVMKRVSVKGATQGNAGSYNPEIAGKAKAVAFETDATNLVTGDRNGRRDILVWTRATKAQRRVSVTDSGGQANGDSYNPSISDGASRVAFVSSAPNLGASQAGDEVLLVRDITAGRTHVTDTCLLDPATGVLCRYDTRAVDAWFEDDVEISGDGSLVAYVTAREGHDWINHRWFLTTVAGTARTNVCEREDGLATAVSRTGAAWVDACVDWSLLYGYRLSSPAGTWDLEGRPRGVALDAAGGRVAVEGDGTIMLWAPATGILLQVDLP